MFGAFEIVVGVEKATVDMVVAAAEDTSLFVRGPEGQFSVKDRAVMFCAFFFGGVSTNKVRTAPRWACPKMCLPFQPTDMIRSSPK